MEQAQITQPAPQPVQTPQPPQPVRPAPSKADKMKSSYNRSALGLGALYEIFQLIGSVFLIVSAVIAGVWLAMGNAAAIEDAGDLTEIINILLESGALKWIVAAYVVGMSVGMTVGLIVMRLIAKRETPIAKKALTVGQFLLVVLFAYGLWGVGAVLGNLPTFFGVEEQNGLDSLLRDLKAEAWPLYLYTCIGAPLFEELACRKLLLDRLHPYGEGFAAVASGLLFGLIHGNSMQFFLAFLLGLLFAMVYLRTGRILYTILLHAIINTTASLPDFFGFANIDVSLAWNIAVGALIVGGIAALIVCRKNALLQPRRVPVNGGNRAMWHNVGMILFRVVGLVMVVTTDLLMMIMTLIANGNPAALLRLIPTTLALLVVLLLPRYTKHFEMQEEIPNGEAEIAE